MSWTRNPEDPVSNPISAFKFNAVMGFVPIAGYLLTKQRIISVIRNLHTLALCLHSLVLVNNRNFLRTTNPQNEIGNSQRKPVSG